MYGRTSPLFIGRKRELDFLGEAWRDAGRRDARIVGVRGASGIGKTELVERFLRTVPGVRTVRAFGDEDALAHPWGVLEQIAEQLPTPVLARTLAGQAEAAFVGQALAAELVAADALIVVVDDAHCGDRQSMAALRLAARRLRNAQVMLLVVHQAPGYATGAAPDAPRLELHEGWARIFDSPQGRLLQVDGLPADDLVRLAVATGHDGLTLSGARRLHEHTDGNALHSLLLLDQVEMHSINFGNGPLPAPRGMTQAVVARLASCDRRTREVVGAAAVLGRRFGLTDLRALAGVADATTPLAEAVGAGLVKEIPGTAGQEFAFTTLLVWDGIYYDSGIERRRVLHRSAALLGGPGALWHGIAASGGGTDGELAELAQEEARFLLARGRLPLAAVYARHAVELTPPGPDRVARLLTAVETLLVSGDATVARRYESEVLAAPRGPWRDYVAGYQALISGRVAEAKLLLVQALGAAERDGAENPHAPADLRARIAAQLAIIGVVEISYPEMVEYGTAAVAAGSHEPWVRAFAWFARSLGWTLAGRAEEALASLTDADLPGSVAGLDGLVARGMIRLWTDDLEGASADLRDGVARATRGEALRVGQALGFLGEVEFRRGRLDDAVQFTRLAVGDAEENERVWDYALLHSLACFPQAARGEWDQAREHARQAAEWAPIVESRVSLAYAAGARAAIAQAQGDTQRLLVAAEAIEAHYDSLEPGTHLFGPVCADALSQLGRVEEAEAALDVFTDRAASSGRRSTLMSIARVRGQIAAARGDHTRAVRECEEALALAREVGLPIEAGRIDLVMTRSQHARGRHAEAERLLRRALVAFNRTGAAAYAALALKTAEELRLSVDGPNAAFSSLTGAEREVVAMVCEGMTTRQIAQRRSVTISTVETQLNRIYAKLNVTNRIELRAVLSDPGD
ncbi:AAA family ATPase [Streptosporangium sp. NPDC000509]|uniref:helix-turn-helix transcriptional regulator n=1 Tax=Streptosporangium sp. NPDC000509 TaxID=3366186 RepID=UPI0036D15304